MGWMVLHISYFDYLCPDSESRKTFIKFTILILFSVVSFSGQKNWKLLQSLENQNYRYMESVSKTYKNTFFGDKCFTRDTERVLKIVLWHFQNENVIN